MKFKGIMFSLISISLISFTAIYGIFDDTEPSEKVVNDISGEITFATNRTDKKDEIAKIIKEFEEIHPEVKVNLETIGNVEEILRRKASVGELADVTLVPSSIRVEEFKDYFLPLNDLGFSNDTTYNYNMGTDENGDLYAMSSSMIWIGIVYNKQAFKEAGIYDIPKTNKEFFEDCIKLKEKGITPMGLNYKQSWFINEWAESIPYLYEPNIEKNVIEDKKEILSEKSGMFKSLEFARNIYQNGYSEKDPLNYEWEQCKKDVKDGKTAMVVWSSDFQNQLVEMGASKSDIGMFPLPESNLINIIGDYEIAVSKNTKFPEVSKEFYKFLFEHSRYAEAVNITSSMKDNSNSQEMLKEINDFNITVKYQADTLKSLSKDDIRNQTMFLNNKRILELDYEFVQNYISLKDTKSLREDINKQWKNIKYET